MLFGWPSDDDDDVVAFDSASVSFLFSSCES